MGPNSLDCTLESESLGNAESKEAPRISNRTPNVNPFEEGLSRPIHLPRVPERPGYLEACLNEQDVSDPQVRHPSGHPQVCPTPHLHHPFRQVYAPGLEGETGEGRMNRRLPTQDTLEQDGLSGSEMHEVIPRKHGVHTQAGSEGGKQEQAQQEGDDLHQWSSGSQAKNEGRRNTGGKGHTEDVSPLGEVPTEEHARHVHD